MIMAENFLNASDMVVGYDSKPLISAINFGVKRGEILTLIGPNGAGKSTILKSISRQLKLLNGKVILASEELNLMSYRDLSQKMSLMLTERVNPELMEAHDVIATGRYPYTGRFGILSEHDEEKIEEAMELVQVTELSTRYFSSLSDGQKQRVLLARAICQEPEIMILDEPTSFLDVKYKLELLGILRRMAKEQQVAIILSLHEIDLAAKVSDRILCVKGDRISHYGMPDEIFNEETIRDLYEIDQGFFDPCFGSIELQKPVGTPQVFVISSGGSGIETYRNLQKKDIPFIAGILYENDIDYRLARLLAHEVITEAPFQEISDEVFERALARVKECEGVINAGVPIGQCNRRIAELLDAIEAMENVPLYTPETYFAQILYPEKGAADSQ